MTDRTNCPSDAKNDPLKFIPSVLTLENGASFPGWSPFWQKGAFYGETVFTTGMTGYPETLTDPSYTGQILSFTYPLIGNYGIPKEEEWESGKIHAAGVVVSQACSDWSHYQGLQSLVAWLWKQKVPLITGVDTRALTKALRQSGTMLGVISANPKERLKFIDPNRQHLVSRASCEKEMIYGNGKKVVVAIDCGMKENIIRHLEKLPITIKRVPYNHDFTKERYDGIFISNGPGDPMSCSETIPFLKIALSQQKPIFGICLGTQLMAIASGAKTYKLPFGHRGHNQPCIDLETEKCYITSQNHGYAVNADSLSQDWKITFKNLNDSSVEGIAHKTKPFFAVQFHPEASPGPTDTCWLFDKFYKML